jgi:energy-coupling factor transporter ATP-binding protein EcfA2
VFAYKNEIVLNNKFNKSTNIILDKEDCQYYLITQSTKDILNTFFTTNYHNSIALIGPFGSGKSSFILYLNTLLANTNDKCGDILKSNNKKLYDKYKKFIENKKFLNIKIVGEHISFKQKFKEAILKKTILKKTIKYLSTNESYQISKALEYIDDDLQLSTYTDIFFSIDEFGKFIEYGIDNEKNNDIFDLQTLAEFINKKSNYKLIISLHKAFSEYGYLQITYTDWDKIQGRFENIVFKDDYYEMLNILKETIIHKDTKHINNAKKLIQYIHNNSFKNTDNVELFVSIAPIHPFVAIAISEIFTKHFQNQRSIFSFLFSVEPHAFSEFISVAREESILYELSELYQYVSYLLKVYNILLPDQEIWYIAEHILKNTELQDGIQKDIIKTIALIHSFKFTNILKTDDNMIVLSLISKYKKDDIKKAIEKLRNDNILIFQEQSKSYSLIENSNININKELKNRLEKHTNINIEEKLNNLIQDKYIIAKRYFIKFGSKHTFEKIYVEKNLTQLKKSYKIYLTTIYEKKLLDLSKTNTKSLFIHLENITNIEYLIKKIEALNDIEKEYSIKLSSNTKDIIKDMRSDATIVLQNLFSQSYIKSKLYHNGQCYINNSKILQELISNILETEFPKTPIINNYTLNHTIVNKGTNTTIIKKLFEAMLCNENKASLGIEKFPAHKALYLSVIKPSGMHIQNKDNTWSFAEPTELNFKPIWKVVKTKLSKKICLNDLIEILQKEPFGLHEVSAMFIVSLFILINRERIHIIFDNTYKYVLTIDLLMHMWKATNRYQLQFISLNSNEERLFKAYVEITTDLTDYSYSTQKVSSIIKTLYNKFVLLPNYAKNTQKISNEAKALRSALVSMKDPKEAFFKLFPQSLGYKDIENVPNDEFIEKFKSAFNEIALSYKNEIIELEKFFAKLFHFNHTVFPYGNNLVKLSNKLSKIDSLDVEIKALLRSFNYSNSFIALIDNISIVLIDKKIEDCYDNDINILKDKLSIVADKILSKLDIVDIATEHNDIVKISLSSLDSNLDKVISINKEKLDIINDEMIKIRDVIPNNLSKEERLYLLSRLLNEELKNE